MMVYDRMKLNKKARDLSLPQPQEAVYFGTAKEDIGKYCATLKKRHPDVEKPWRLRPTRSRCSCREEDFRMAVSPVLIRRSSLL